MAQQGRSNVRADYFSWDSCLFILINLHTDIVTADQITSPPELLSQPFMYLQFCHQHQTVNTVKPLHIVFKWNDWGNNVSEAI